MGSGGGGAGGLPISGGDWGIFGGWNFRFRDFLGEYFIYVGIFCIFKTIWSWHSYVIDETEEVLGCLGCLFFWGVGVDFCPH